MSFRRCLDYLVIIVQLATLIGLTVVDSEILTNATRHLIVKDIDSHVNLDLIKFDGIWYEISHSPYPVEFSSVRSVIRYMRAEEDSQTLLGYYAAAINGTCLPVFRGQIRLFCKNGPGDFFARGITVPSPWGITKVLYTDYQHAILYFCSVLNEDGTCRNGGMVTILARSKNIDPEILSFLEDTVENKTGIPPSDLKPAEYYENCFHQIVEASKQEFVDSCDFSEVQIQTEFNPEKFSGKWHLTYSSEFVPTVYSPLCFSGASKSNNLIEGFHMKYLKDGRIYCSIPQNPLNDEPSDSSQLGVFPLKVLYTDYMVAVGLTCVDMFDNGDCLSGSTGAVILSKYGGHSSVKLDDLIEIAANSCISVLPFKENEITEKHIDCDCEPAESLPESEDGQPESLPHNEETPDNEILPTCDEQMITQTLLGTWFDYAGSAQSFKSFSESDELTYISTYYRLGPNGYLMASRKIETDCESEAEPGLCPCKLVNAVEEVVCDGERDFYHFKTIKGTIYGYPGKVVHMDSEILVTASCSGEDCHVHVDNIRVITKSTSTPTSRLEEKIHSVLHKFGINASTLVRPRHGVSGKCPDGFSEPRVRDEVSCRTADFKVHENFTVSLLEGSWNVLAHFSVMNGSVSNIHAAVVHYRDQSNGSMEGFITGSTASGHCLPLLKIQVNSLCPWEFRGTGWTEEIDSVFDPGAPLLITATWKVLFIDEEHIVVINCQQEDVNGTCPIEKTRVSIMGRSFGISEKKRTLLNAYLTQACIDPARLTNTTSTTSDLCLGKMKEALDLH